LILTPEVTVHDAPFFPSLGPWQADFDRYRARAHSVLKKATEKSGEEKTRDRALDDENARLLSERGELLSRVEELSTRCETLEVAVEEERAKRQEGETALEVRRRRRMMMMRRRRRGEGDDDVDGDDDEEEEGGERRPVHRQNSFLIPDDCRRRVGGWGWRRSSSL
jgi:hypothetical protein